MDFLSNSFQKIINKIKGIKLIKEKHIEEIMEEIRLSLLQADVNYEVVEEFNSKVKSKALGQEVLKSLNPSQQVIKILNDTLVEVLNSKNIHLNFANNNEITTFMLIGLQGSGKTTTAGKLAILAHKKFQKKVLLIACDIYRPGAIEQLQDIGNRININVFFKKDVTVENIISEGLKYASLNQYDVVIIDTAGTLSINKAMIQELKMIKNLSNPSEIFLVVDVLFGKEITNVAKTFNEKLQVTGVILTKMDADVKGGAVLSVKATTNLPIKLMSSSEKINDLEFFDAKRMASRLLGMGDILTVIEKVTDNIDKKQGKKMIDRLLDDDYNYYDFQKQLKMLKKIGSIGSLLKLIPGLSSKFGNLNLQDFELNKFESIIKSMTKEEKFKTNLISLSSRRRMRIAKGSGVKQKDVLNLISLLEQQKKIAKQMGNFEQNKINLEQDPNFILEKILNQNKDK
ncbi:Signal recognition particle [Candidatus Phytoplasma mali]|uniref:signal-recognition-particle GTPase n=1 Tax=Phytoplasma mali (strain AT) TaxID=482235 RepID=B3R096_PHYMT|nr:signal recognition particle protein [Candidatus Phytoplasma mali]CAP18260.1 Signal recognition particle [Candidatus Phytoplasma mali]